MNSKQLWTVLTSAVYAILFFGVVMGVSMYAVTFNADWSPAVIWFPVPVLALLGVATFWAQRQWSIGLTVPANVPLGPVYGFGIAVTILGVSVCILQGAYHGLVRHVEVVSTDVTPVFAFTYHFLMSIVAALLPACSFRSVSAGRV